MLVRHLFRSLFTSTATIVFGFSLLLPIACDAVSNVTSGKPSTSAPNANDASDYVRSCDEKEDAIRDWERGQERKVEDEWMDGKRGMLQTGMKLEQVAEDAKAMRRELRDNCEAKMSDSADSGRTKNCVDADDMDGIRAEYRANQKRANQKYVGQQMCLRGTVVSFTESTNYSRVNARVGDEPLFGVMFSISHRKGSGGRDGDEAWESWIMSMSVGDTLEAECTVEQFWSPDIPTFRDCKQTGG